MTATDDPVLLSEDRDWVRTLTLNRPHRKNAITPVLWIALRDALNGAGRDRSVRALVITGAGGSFCSGADISVRDDVHPKDKLQRLTDVALALHELPIPTVAKVSGVAVGAGWNLALGCDLVVATPESTFCQIFSKRGLSIDLGGSWLLPKLVGPQQAKRLAVLAETIDAAEAHALNVVTWVVSAAEIDAFVDDLADRLAAADRACPDQCPAERGRQPHPARRTGQRGSRAGRQFRDHGCRGRLCRFRGATRAVVYWSMGADKI
jgi:enoyl-CoA hydratase/carnithine racemase